MIVTSTTLLFSLRTIANIWRYEYQNRNAQELVRQCTALYDKFVGFVADLEDIGRRLKAAQSSYDDAYGKLASGKGNLIPPGGAHPRARPEALQAAAGPSYRAGHRERGRRCGASAASGP
jgi:hypothetical protein